MAKPRKQKRKLEIPIPDWAAPLLQPARYKGIKGGRGGGKSQTVSELQLLAQIQNPNRNLVCIREVQKSLKDSVKRLLEQKIREYDLGKYFVIRSSEIRSAKGDGVILFQGMSDHTADSIKSLEGMDCAWVEEAQVLSARSMKMLRPTIRKPNSEIWFTWNPQNEEDPVDRLLCQKNRPADAIVITVNYTQNPFLPAVLAKEAEHARNTDPDAYSHIWGGDYERFSEARIFKNWRVDTFDTPKDAILRFGCDWGFSPDPMVLLRGFIEGRRLYIDYEAYEIECEIEDTRELFLTVPQSEKFNIVCGSDRPERIRSARRQGFKTVPAVRGPNSVMEGVEWLQNYEIIIHTRCPHAQDEFKNYKRPIDPLTGQILPMLPKKKNHVIEAARYMVESVRRFAQGKPLGEENDTLMIPTTHYWSRRAS